MTSRASTSVRPTASRCRRAMAATSSRLTAASASSWPRAAAAQAGWPSTTCWRACRRARSAASPISSPASRRGGSSAGCRWGCLASLRKKFPAPPFLIVRYGDHQPEFSSNLLDPGLDEARVARKFDTYDPRYFTTYYAIDAINSEPVKSSAVMDKIDAPYLPLVVQEAAGIPLDP